MEQTTKRGPGRPAQKKEAPKKAAPVVRRKIDESPRPRLFRADAGGMFLKVKNTNLSVYDKESGRVRGLRYCPAENSVWIDEQSSNATVEQVVFNEKMLFVPVEKPNLLKFLQMHPGNKANGGMLFYEPEPKEKVAEKSLEEEFMVNDAIAMIKNRPIDELLPVAMALNIDTNQKDITIKQSLVRQAKGNPEKFMSLFDSPMVNARSVVMQAFDFQIVDSKNGGVVWFDTGKLIVSVPVGQDKVDVLTRFVMTDKGSTILSELERQLGEIA